MAHSQGKEGRQAEPILLRRRILAGCGTHAYIFCFLAASFLLYFPLFKTRQDLLFLFLRSKKVRLGSRKGKRGCRNQQKCGDEAKLVRLACPPPFSGRRDSVRT